MGIFRKTVLLSLFITLGGMCLGLFGFPAERVYAGTYDISKGDITIDVIKDLDSKSHLCVHQGRNVIDDNPVITGGSTTNKIIINTYSDNTVKIKLSDISIDLSATISPAIKITGDGNAEIELVGDNTLKSGEGCAGIQKENSGYLKIYGTGSLKVTGGVNGAGIGGGNNQAGQNITITGGTVIATSGDHGAGIGGGNGGAGTNIEINGGTVTATGGGFGAGIGGGNNQAGQNITITGGTVTATGGEYGAGIGGGQDSVGNTIKITGGDVTATGGIYGAGIGGGCTQAGENITITGGTVIATGGNGGAGIGGGCTQAGSNIVIKESAKVMAAGGNSSFTYKSGAAIGSGGKNGTDGTEIDPETYKPYLYDTGFIKYYTAGTSVYAINAGTARHIKYITGAIITSKTVTFDANGGTCGTATATTVSSNGSQVLTSLPEAVRDNYYFDGWFTAADGGDKITTAYAFTSDMTVYAHWKTPAPGPDPGPDPKQDTPEETPITVSDNKPMAVSTETRGDFKITYAHEIPFYGKGKVTTEYFGGLTVTLGDATYKVTKIKVNKKKGLIQITGLEDADKETVNKIKKATKGSNGLPFKCNPYYVRDTDKVTPKFKKNGALKSVKVFINGKDYKAKKDEYSYDSSTSMITFKDVNLSGSYKAK